jgi:hypothetical protein
MVTTKVQVHVQALYRSPSVCVVVAIQNTKFTVPNLRPQIRPGRKGLKFPNI